MHLPNNSCQKGMQFYEMLPAAFLETKQFEDTFMPSLKHGNVPFHDLLVIKELTE